jgi:hypothetical protein
MLKRLLSCSTAAGLLLAFGAAAAADTAWADTAWADTVPAANSANWAGYVASAPSGGSGFTRVSGTWVQPTAGTSAGDGDSAFWVGLGGNGQSNALEQVGTQANVANGEPVYYAWYELLPAAPVKLDLAIHPGDRISASVAVSATNVAVSLSDQTTAQSYTNTLPMTSPDTSSAEWIAEAPSASDGQGNFQPLPLADFGSVTFASASATAGGHTGTIADSSWSAEPVALSESSSATAQPSSLSSDGSSFSVARQAAADSSASAGSATPGGYGPAGGGYGYGGYGTYGGGYGPPGGGYGAYGYPADAY